MRVYNSVRFGKGTGKLRTQWMIRDYPDNSIAKIDQNSMMSPIDLSRLVVTQPAVEDLLQTLV